MLSMLLDFSCLWRTTPVLTFPKFERRGIHNLIFENHKPDGLVITKRCYKHFKKSLDWEVRYGPTAKGNATESQP